MNQNILRWFWSDIGDRDFSSYVTIKKSNTLQTWMIVIFPFLVEVLEVFFFTAKKIFKLEISIKYEHKYILAIIVKTIAIVFTLLITWWTSNRRWLFVDVHIWILVIFWKLFFDIEGFFGKSPVIVDLISQIKNFIYLLIMVALFIYYGFFDCTIKNTIRRFFYKDGFFNECGKYELLDSQTVDMERVVSAFICIFKFTLCIITISFMWYMFHKWLNKMLSVPKTPTSYSTKNNQFIHRIYCRSPLDMAFSALIMAPLYEEIIYRHVLIKMSGNTTVSWVLSSIIFSLIHLHGEDIFVFINYFLPSLMLGYIYNKRRNLMFTILIHFLWNLNALVSMLLRWKCI